MFSALKLILTMECEQATRLISDGLDRKLTRSERIAVRMHAWICWCCARYRKQARFLQAAAQERGEQLAESLSPVAKERILAALQTESRAAEKS